MKKILIIGTADIYGGVGVIIKEYCTRLYQEEIRFDFLYYDEYQEGELKYFKEINANYYVTPQYSKHPIKFMRYMKRICKKNEYDIIHCHASTAFLMIYAIPFYLMNRTPIICHSHLDYSENYIGHYLIRPIVMRFAQKKLAVSQNAGIWMYGKKAVASGKVDILKNGVDFKKYMFSNTERQRIRAELDISDKYVIGNVGRFELQKNHKFMIEIFEKIYQINSNVMLLLVGEGSLKEQIKELVENKGLSDKVIILDNKENIFAYYSAMDVFLFPSRNEGLGLVAVEAQISGLAVLASTAVPEEAKISENYFAFDLDVPIEKWVEQLMIARDIKRNPINIEDIEKYECSMKYSVDKLKLIYNNIK